jgi:DNA-directed RNA polymerase subunit RPC12/RpoP
MRMARNGVDVTNERRDPSAAPRSGHLMLWIILFVIGCTVLGPGIAFGVFIGWDFLPWVLGGFFLFTLIFFVRAVIRASGADQVASMWRGVDFRETMRRLNVPERSEAVPEKEPAPRPVRMRTRCPNCGASVSAGNITKIDGVPAVHCPYCDTLYTLEDAAPV